MINKSQSLLLNRDVKFEPTVKQYFNKYCFKLVLFAPGGRAIYNTTRSIEQSIQLRQQVSKHYNRGGSWSGLSRPWPGYAYDRFLNLADVDVLSYIKNQKVLRKNSVKVRVEEPYISFYAVSEDELFDIAKNLPGSNYGLISIVASPGSKQDKELLEQGAILTSKPPEFLYKIMLRSGRFTIETKKSIFNYLYGLGSDVGIPAGSKNHLLKHGVYMYNVYFYCNDEKIVTFLNLIAPNIVVSINSLVHKTAN